MQDSGISHCTGGGLYVLDDIKNLRFKKGNRDRVVI